EGVKHIESTSQEGLSSIVVQFRLEVPTQVASQDMRSKVASIRSDLPRDIEEPLVLRINPNEMPIVSVALNAESLTPQGATDLADKVVKKRLETVEGVGAVNLVGEAKREIGVVVDRSRLEAYRLTLADVVKSLRQENLDAPSGSADRGATESLVRVAARGRTAEQIGNIPVKRLDGATIYVRDVAQTIDGIKEPKNIAMSDESPALTLDVQKQWGANTVAVANGVRTAVAKLQKEMPAGVTLQVVRDDSNFIRESIDDVQMTMILGGLLTVLIVFLFLNSWRSTVI